MSIFTEEKNVDYEATAQRTEIKHYMDVTPSGTEEGNEVYRQLGVGWTSMTESPSAQTKTRKFINEKSERESITRYKPSYAFETMLMFNDPAIRKTYKIYKQRKTGSDAIVKIITVDTFEKAVNGSYPAYKGNYAVQVSSCDDDDEMIIKGNFVCQGDEVEGWFNPTEGTWSDTEPTAAAASQSDAKTAEEASSDNSEQSDSTVTETGTDETENT